MLGYECTDAKDYFIAIDREATHLGVFQCMQVYGHFGVFGQGDTWLRTNLRSWKTKIATSTCFWMNESPGFTVACIKSKDQYKSRLTEIVAIIALFLFCGLRRGNCSIKATDVNIERTLSGIAKNKERIVPLNETVKVIDYLAVRPNG